MYRVDHVSYNAKHKNDDLLGTKNNMIAFMIVVTVKGKKLVENIQNLHKFASNFHSELRDSNK